MCTRTLLYSPKDTFSSILSCLRATTECMGLSGVCLGTCSQRGVLLHLFHRLIFKHIHVLTYTHVLTCACSHPGSSLSPGQLAASQSLPRISMAGYRVRVWQWLVIQQFHSQSPGCLYFSRPLSSQARLICHMRCVFAVGGARGIVKNSEEHMNA